jgi:hypothetical protein
MLDQEPLWYPSRDLRRFPYNPGVPDRQLWAIGMVVVQWGMTETIIDQQIANLVGDDAALEIERKNLRNFQQTVDFFERLMKIRAQETTRSQGLNLVQRIKNLSAQRDEVIHRLWGGGIQHGSWNNPEGYPSIDAALIRNRDDPPYKGRATDVRNTISWRLTFNGIRKIASEIAALNRDLFVVFMIVQTPPDDPARRIAT